jgi:cell division protein FtsB
VTGSSWNAAAPRRPIPGSGRTALGKRGKTKNPFARRVGEKRAAVAARRALNRRKGGARSAAAVPLAVPKSLRGAAIELRRFSQLVEQRFLSRQRLRHVLIALAGLWVLWTFVIGDAGLFRLWSVKHQNAKLEKQIEELTAQEEVVQAEVQALTDPKSNAVERIAREEHGMVRPGEKLVKFYED